MPLAAPRARPGAPAPSIGILLAICLIASPPGATALAQAVPSADHVIVVIMENKSYDQAGAAPFTASLADSGSWFSASYAITHPSQPNYIALWSGGLQGVTNNNCPVAGYPLSAENLGHACETAGISWRAYCENLPSPGYTGCSTVDGLYVRKHAPWTSFNNVDHLNERPYGDLAIDVAAGTLPRLAFVVPNQCNNTHDCPVATGDAWLSANLPGMIQAAGPSGFVVLTWDEDDYASGNHILTVFCGGLVRRGYIAMRTINHYTLLRTIGDAIGLAPFGAAITEAPITDIWNLPNTGVRDERGPEPRLERVARNPSTGAFEVVLSLPEAIDVHAAVYDVAGRKVTTLLDERRSGEVRLRWNSRRAGGRAAPGGVYVLRVRAAQTLLEEKLIVTR